MITMIESLIDDSKNVKQVESVKINFTYLPNKSTEFTRAALSHCSKDTVQYIVLCEGSFKSRKKWNLKSIHKYLTLGCSKRKAGILLSALKHPNVVTMLVVAVTDKQSFEDCVRRKWNNVTLWEPPAGFNRGILEYNNEK